ncbi:MAG TPA: 16S rRNA (guanine(966)-N(2))-methyltransferase RsmD [Thermoanaerobaculia bacterium]|nr:16S rRNA (guanine(966)-N(2))-methyltransferase RsmD [Thermoanaerobaculia bacterium]
MSHRRAGGVRGARGVRGVRIMGGEARGRAVAVARGVRPTEGRVREALFSIWQERLPGARFLDLYAGSGAVGLEALSRGAAAVLFVESDPRALRELERSVGLFAPERARRWRASLPGGLGELARRAGSEWDRFDLVFADPPYAFEAHPRLLAGIEPLLAPEGEAAIEHSARRELPEESSGLARASVRVYGETALSFYSRRK